METFWRELRLTIRGLIQAPQYAVSVVLVLGIGIGVITSMFSMTSAYRFRSAPVRDGGSLVTLAVARPGTDTLSNVSLPNLQDIRNRNSVFSALVGYAPLPVRVRAAAFSERLSGQVVTGDYFHDLGVMPALGRVLTPNDDTVQAEPAVVISHDLWEKHLRSDPAVAGQTFYVNGSPFVVAGVSEKGFRGTDSLFHADVWIPLSKAPLGGRAGSSDRRADNLRVLGRLRPGIGLREAQANLDILTGVMRSEHPEENRGLKAVVMWEKAARPEVQVAGKFSLILAFVMVAQVLGLILTGANITSLMLARAVARQRNVTLRIALGATRWHVYREIVLESLILSGAAAAVGLAAAYLSLNILSSVQLPGVGSFYMDWQPDGSVFAFAMAIAMVMAMAIAIVPAWTASHTSLQSGLQGGIGSGSSVKVSRLRYRVVASQFTTVTLALMTAGVLSQASASHPHEDPGFKTEDRLVLRVSTTDAGYTPQRGRQFIDDVLGRLRGLPGVIDADIAEDVRMTFDRMSMEIQPEGGVRDSAVDVSYNVVGNAYFRTMGISLTQGRPFAASDSSETPRVAIVNERLAERFWPGRRPLGKRFTVLRNNVRTAFEVVGVEKTGRYYSLNEPPREFFYLPHAQEYRPTLAVIIHTESNPLAMVGQARQILQELAPQIAPFDVATQEQMIDVSQFAAPKLAGTVMGILGAVQFLIAAIGMYGLLSYLARLQSREIGVRLALGATTQGIVALYLNRGGRLALRGLLQGSLGALAVVWVMRRFFPGFQSIPGYNATVTIGVIALVTAVAALSVYLPVRRVLADDPMAALRQE